MRKKFFSFLVLVLISGFLTPFSQSQAIGETLGYSTSIDIYLDVNNPNYTNGQVFNWSVGVRASDVLGQECWGSRNFSYVCTFNKTEETVLPYFTCGVSGDHLASQPSAEFPVYSIFQTGWYSFKHRFLNDGTGHLKVEMDLADKNGNLSSWIMSNPGDIIGQTVGHLRHGWLTKNDFGFLPIDNAQRYEYALNDFSQGFEVDNSGWFRIINNATNNYYPQIISSNSTGIPASSGDYYALIESGVNTNWGLSTQLPYQDCSWPSAPVKRSGEIISPESSAVVSGFVSFQAKLYNDSQDDGMNWSVKQGGCQEEGAIKIGQTNHYSSWDGVTFSAGDNTYNWTPGQYCFVFDPLEREGEEDIFLTREFVVKDQTVPTAEILNPADNSTWSGPVTISAKATDLELTRCELTIKSAITGGAVVRAVEQFNADTCRAGISVDWNAAADNIASGDYIISFQAFDGANMGEDVHRITIQSPVAETCTAWTYSDWGACVGGTRTRTIEASFPVGCEGGTPEALSETCTAPVDLCIRPYEKEDCMKGGWKYAEKLLHYNFRNQGDCVSFLESAYNAHCYKY